MSRVLQYSFELPEERPVYSLRKPVHSEGLSGEWCLWGVLTGGHYKSDLHSLMKNLS